MQRFCCGRDPVSLLYCFSTSGTASGAEVAGPSRLGLTARLAMNPARQNALLQDSEDQPDPTSEPSPPRVVVFGGNGYIGTHVCQAALALGLDVTAIGRSGRPQYSTGPWGDQVNWVAADALEVPCKHRSGCKKIAPAAAKTGNAPVQSASRC